MVRFRLSLVLLLVCPLAAAQAPAPAWLDAYRPIAQRIITASESSAFAWRRLAELTDTFGNRLSGSATLEQAIDWVAAAMKKDGLDNVRKERVMVPHWVRGHESLDLIAPVRQPMVMLGLGNSVGTPASGIEADVIVVKNYEEMNARAADRHDRAHHAEAGLGQRGCDRGSDLCHCGSAVPIGRQIDVRGLGAT